MRGLRRRGLLGGKLHGLPSAECASGTLNQFRMLRDWQPRYTMHIAHVYAHMRASAVAAGGPYCRLCDETYQREVSVYYDKGAQACKPCKEGGALPEGVNQGLVVLGGVVALLALLFAARFALKRHARQRSGSKSWVRKKARWWRRHAASVKRRSRTKIKILFTFYQIATRVGETYVVTFPPSVESSLQVAASGVRGDACVANRVWGRGVCSGGEHARRG